MHRKRRKNDGRRAAATLPGALCLLLVALAVAGCSSTSSPATTTQQDTPQTYFGPATNKLYSQETFAIDHSANPTCPVDSTTGLPACTFAQYQYRHDLGYEQFVYNSGYFTPLANGILSIGVTYSNGNLGGGTLSAYNPQAANSWAVELPGQAGLVGLSKQTVVPIASNESCPSLATAQPFQFVTIPNAGDSTGTAYGSVSIGTSGSTVNFNNISQYTVGGSNTPTNHSLTPSVQGSCGQTVYGQTIGVPDTTTVTGSEETLTPSATIAIAPSGFLVEDNGMLPAGNVGSGNLPYQPVLGAGVGAIGLPVPTSAVTTSTLIGTQYVGFIYTTGWQAPNSGPVVVPPSSLIASFGFPNQTACPNLPAQTGTIIYGGEFSNNNPSANAVGNCDIAVDLGAQSATTYGLYPNATVWVGSPFPRTPSSGKANQPQTASSFSAVAIAGQIQGKYAIFLIGYDPTSLNSVVTGATQDWGIYLLQSN
jgi:hypothetical protein